MRLSRWLLAVVLAPPAVLIAQTPAASPDAVVQIERQRADAIRDGQNAARFYSPAYYGISALGQYETSEQAIRADASHPRMRDVAVESHGGTSIVTGVETLPGAGDRERVLRIWTRDNAGAWTITAAQTTWMGNRAGAAPPSGPLPDTVETFTPHGAVEESLWKSQDALMRSFSEADAASYRLFSTGTSLRMTTSGDAIPRDQWLETIAKRAKGPLAVVDEVRIASYGDVGVVTLRGHEASPTRQSWVYLKQDGVWKLHLRFTTPIR
jgi:hypothetical protein